MILDKIVEDKKIRLVEHKKAVSFQDIRNQAEKTPTRKKDCFYNNLKKILTVKLESVRGKK